MATNGNPLAVRLHYYQISDNTILADLGEHVLIIPYWQPRTSAGTGNIVEYGLATERLIAWGDLVYLFQAAGGPVRPTDPTKSSAMFEQFFPNYKPQSTADYIAVENVVTGQFLADSSSDTRLYASKAEFLNSGTYTTVGGTGFLRLSSSASSGSTRGRAYLMYYRNFDETTQKIISANYIEFEGATSTQNTIRVSAAPDLVTISNSLLEFLSGGITEYDPNPPGPTGDDPYSGGGTSEPGGGGGDYTLVNDPIDFPDTPTISVAQAGFVSIWIPTLSQIQDLANFMWNADPLKIDFWKKLIANPLELILGLQLVPFEVPTETNPASVTLGIIDSEIEMNYTDQQYHEIDCGSLDLTEYWGGFLDYAPFTSVDIFLPYIGVRSLNVNDCMPKTIAVKYKVDIVSGACVAIVKCGDSVIYHFPGNIAAQVPVTTLQMQQIVGGVMQAAVSIGTAVATGGIGGAVAAALGASTAIANTGTHSDRSGSVAGNVGFMDNQTPYLIVTRPRQAVPEEQNKYTGYPAYITVALADLTGYTEVNIVHLQGLSCTKAEAEEITRLLLEGVIF